MKLFQNLWVKGKIECLWLSLARGGSKTIQRLVFYSIILFLPTQFGRHFWPNFSYVQGLRIDYLSPTLYLTDVLIGILFCFWLFSKLKTCRGNNFKISTRNLFLTLFIIFIGTGVFLSKNPLAGVYGLIKLIEFIFFGYYVSKNIDNLKTIISLFSVGIIFESLLSILQFINNGSLNFLLYYFGERSFNSQTPGIANASLGGELVLRPYGTFSHPNVLAGYLTIVMAMVISNFRKTLFIFSLIIGTIALLLSMSRIAIILWTVILFGYLLNLRQKGPKRVSFLICLFIIMLFIGSILVFSPLHFRFLGMNFNDQAFIIRKDLIVSSVLMLKDNLLFGVGINNFLTNLPYFQKQNLRSFFEYLQPVHNIYLLVLTQTGLIGFLFFLYFLSRTIKKTLKKELSILLVVLILGLFDHYFLTIQQGQLLFSFVLGICWSEPNTK